MKTIAQQINWNFEANGELGLFDKNGRPIYWETSNECWVKREYDSQGKEIYFEDSDGYWGKSEYDSKGNRIYFEDSDGYWIKSEYDSQGKLIYLENSKGFIKDNRPKPCEDKVVEIDGIKYKLTKV